MYTQQDILNELDRADQETYHFFIDLQHPYLYTAGSRLTLYADEERWAVVFEKSGYGNRSYCGQIELDYFGNCLQNLQSEIPGDPSTSNNKRVILIQEEDLRQIEEDFELVAQDKGEIPVRNSVLPIEQDLAKYLARQIKPQEYDNPKKLVDFPSLIRYLDEDNPSLFRATDEELSMCLPAGLPKIMQIDRWHHEVYYVGKKMTSVGVFEDEPMGASPSSYETYRMIADVLVWRDPAKWAPTLPPNNDWRNWPDAGGM